MKPDELANEIERLSAAAEPAPWNADYSPNGPIWQAIRRELTAMEDADEVDGIVADMCEVVDANLIVALRNAAPLIVAALRLAEDFANACDLSVNDTTSNLALYVAARAASESR